MVNVLRGRGRPLAALVVALLAVALTATARLAAPARQAKLPVLTFVLAGQSNMEGQGRIDGRTPVDPRVTVLTSAGWVTATEPLPQGLPDPPSPQLPGLGVGPGIALADNLIAKRRASQVRLISCSINGSPIKLWIPGAAYYDACAAQIKAAGHVDGVLFYQGETDALSTATAKIWAHQFKRFVAGMQHLTRHARIMFAQLGPYPTDPFRVAWNLVKAQQASIRLTGVTMVRTDDLPVFATSTVHHTAAAERAIGLRFAKPWRLGTAS